MPGCGIGLHATVPSAWVPDGVSGQWSRWNPVLRGARLTAVAPRFSRIRDLTGMGIGCGGSYRTFARISGVAEGKACAALTLLVE
jgi:hypothetical protein